MIKVFRQNKSLWRKGMTLHIRMINPRVEHETEDINCKSEKKKVAKPIYPKIHAMLSIMVK